MEYKLIIQIALVFALTICGFVICLSELEKYPTKKGCELVEISPDFSLKEKQVCRFLNSIKK